MSYFKKAFDILKTSKNSLLIAIFTTVTLNSSIKSADGADLPTCAVIETYSPRERAMDLLREFMDLSKYPNKAWVVWIDEINAELKKVDGYVNLEVALEGLKNAETPANVGLTLKNYKSLLAPDIQSKIDDMTIMQLYNLMSKRLKAGNPSKQPQKPKGKK